MAYNTTTQQWDLDANMVRLQAEKKAGVELQQRKHSDWDDNYELFRGKVRTNRLTQKQAVNIPLMKETIKTLLSKIDDPPNVDWKELGGDLEKQMVMQEIWNQQVKDNNLELLDIIDKKNVLLYGLSVKKLNIDEDGVCVDVLDVYDILLDPLTKPWDLESARYIIHQNIFRNVRDILADSRYTTEGKDNLKIWADSSPGLVQGDKNKEEWEKKMARLAAMGLTHKDFANFAGGDRLVQLTEHHTRQWDGKQFVKRVVVYADDKIELYNETLVECLGVDFWPFIVWSEDPETTDVYPDSVGDLVRTPNKVVNVWFSQLIENRTLKNFQMHWYMPVEGYSAQTYTPGPGMMLPAPPGDDISKVIMPVEISGLDDTLGAINAITQIVERGTGATAIDKGQPEQGVQTLGEVQILVGKASERATAMAKFYRLAWYELAVKWWKLLDANPPKQVTLYKTGRSGKIYPKRVYGSDWQSKAGYEPTVRSTSEMEISETKTIQKWLFVLQQFPNNPALRQIAQKRELELLDLTPEEMKQVEDAEKAAAQAAANPTPVVATQGQPQPGQPQPGQPAAQPAAAPAQAGGGQNEQVMSQIAQHLANLGQ